MAQDGRSQTRITASRTLVCALAAVAASACGRASGDADPGASFSGVTAIEVLDGQGASMGSVAFTVSCGEEASAEMRLGLALLHNMTYTEAESAFARATEMQPDCALAYWGQAMTYVHPLWPDVPSAASLDRGWELLQEARQAGLQTEREEAYVAALEGYYRDAASRDEPTRLAGYADGWAALSAGHPDDPEAALFTALSMVATAPASDPTMQRQRDAGAIAEQVLEAIPDHPGAHHYIIHAFDSPLLSDRALAVARSYGEVAPENSHALHMTSHIFTREGLWEESIEYNERAAAIALGEPIAGQTSHHLLHALDYLAYAHLQRGADDLAWAVVDRVNTLDGPVVNNAASAYGFAAVRARIALERGRWEDAAALTPREPAMIPWDTYPHIEAIPVFARALGFAHTGDLESARRSVARLGELRSHAESVPGNYDWATQVEIQQIGARAWIAYAEGRTDEAVSLMTEAAALEATTQKNPVTPAEVLPAGELLGDMLMELERYEEAVVAYAAALERNRNRFNSLHGAGLAAELAGDRAIAADYYRRLLDVGGASTTRRPVLARVEAFLGEG